MYAVEVRDHIMIAHSFRRGDVFGPAQALHGATFVVDIGRAQGALKAALAPLDYTNLDAHPDFAGKKSTTETVTKHIFDAMAAAARSGAPGPEGDGIARIRVTLGESHIARAWFEGPDPAA